jgi:murein DD-endopeptidase MepM/ murein hydrolase activator NlpD
MLHASLNLPKYRLHLHLVKRRGSYFEEPILPTLAQIKNTRSGNKVSRFFRHIFEHKHIKKILGANFALLIAANSFAPAAVSGNESPTPLPVVSANEITLKTVPGAQLPVAFLKINQGFSFFHPGVDFEGKTGDPIKPVMPGVVQEIQRASVGYGNAVTINHGNGTASLYAHLSKIKVKVGESMTNDTIIGLVGTSGHSTGSHLHLEVRDHGVPINPLSVLPR